jgi:hypothetical protein
LRRHGNLFGGDLTDGKASGFRQRIAQRLGGNPVLAERTMEIAPEHAEGERGAARQHMVERLLFHRVRLQPGHIAPWRIQPTCAVEAHMANPAPPRTDKAAVATRHATDRAVLLRLGQLGFRGQYIECILQGRHRHRLYAAAGYV